MIFAYLRSSGPSLVVTIPQSYAEQNGLADGSQLSLEIDGRELRLRPVRQRKSLTELLEATPGGLHRAEGWDEMASVGAEQ